LKIGNRSIGPYGECNDNILFTVANRCNKFFSATLYIIVSWWLAAKRCKIL